MGVLELWVRGLVQTASFIALLTYWSCSPLQAGVSLDVQVDATELPRHLVRSEIQIPVEPGPLILWYPKWIPGIHGPGGPVQNLGGFRIFSANGEAIPWQRDPEDPWKFHCDVPQDADRVRVEIEYIANQESVNSVGAGAQGNSFIGAINFNTCLVYPDGYRNDEITVNLRVRLPQGWKHGCALEVRELGADWIEFEPSPLHVVVDSPLICGEYFRSIELKPSEAPPAWLHLTSESPTAIQISDELVAKYRKLIEEANALFGRAPHEEYHFLVTLSDDLGPNGLEHLRSSLNGLREREFVDEDLQKGWWASYLLAHEYAHAWCGKYRRPRGMTTFNYHTPKHTELLWIYEGLTEYLGEVLAVRAGLQDFDRQIAGLAMYIGQLEATKGRRWRTLADTAVVSYQLRDDSTHWGLLRRSQDYYFEGELYWMEADAIIREASNGDRSLDDFCRRFFGRQSQYDVVPFDLEEVYEVLHELADHDWKGFFQSRVYDPQQGMPLEVVERIGYRLEFTSEPSESVLEMERRYGATLARDSLGLIARPDGEILDIVPDSPADQAGLASSQTILGVNGRKFSPQRLKDGIADSTTRRNVELLILEGDRFRTVAIDYSGGVRYLKLTRNPDRRDVLKEILKSRTD